MKKIIQKVLEELNKPEPKLDYIRGLLEAISEEEIKPQIFSGIMNNVPDMPPMPRDTMYLNNHLQVPNGVTFPLETTSTGGITILPGDNTHLRQ